MAYKLGSFTFDTEEELNKAKAELAQIKKISEKYNIDNPEIARKLLDYYKSGKGKLETKIGAAFLQKLAKNAAAGEKVQTGARQQASVSETPDKPSFGDLFAYLLPIIACVATALYTLPTAMKLFEYQAELARLLFNAIPFYIWCIASLSTMDKERNNRVEKYLAKKLPFTGRHLPKKLFSLIVFAFVGFILFTLVFSFMGSEADVYAKEAFLSQMGGSL